MSDRIFAGELNCPLCGHAQLTPTYLPPSVRQYTSEGEEVNDHFGESCDMECKDCGFQFNYHMEQEA